MKQEEDKFTGLPENAFRELKPGEVYNPLMSPKKTYPEVNLWSVAWGIAMAILFSAAAAYLGLKVGQVFEAAIPIAIISSRSIRRSQTQKRTRRKRHYPIHRRLLRRHRGRSHLHTACPLYPASQISGYVGHLYASVHQFTAGRCTGHLVPDSFPQILCKRHAWQVSFSRSDSHHTGAGVG